MQDQRRTNALRTTLEADEVALGALENSYTPELVEFYGDLGLEFVWIDLEHGGPSQWDGDRLSDLARAAEGAGTELLVRLPSPDPAAVRKVLDCGVRSLFVSRVDNAANVRDVVSAAHFRYDGGPGQRGLGSPRARRWGTAADYIATEDEATLVGVTIETLGALESIEEICEVPELGFVFVGPLDLSVALGHPGELDHPEVQAAEQQVLETAREHGTPVGGLGFGMADVNEKVATGYQMVNLGSTTGAVRGTVEAWLEEYDGPS